MLAFAVKRLDKTDAGRVHSRIRENAIQYSDKRSASPTPSSTGRLGRRLAENNRNDALK